MATCDVASELPKFKPSEPKEEQPERALPREIDEKALVPNFVIIWFVLSMHEPCIELIEPSMVDESALKSMDLCCSSSGKLATVGLMCSTSLRTAS